MFRHHPHQVQPHTESQHGRTLGRIGAGLAWFGGLGALVVGVTLLLAQMDPPGRLAATSAEAMALLAPRPAEPATLGGMSRVLGALDQDLETWRRLMAPGGRVVLASMSDRAAQLQPSPPIAEQAAEPGDVALVALGMTLAAALLLAGIVALMLERLLLAPFRALRGAAAAMAEGHLDSEVPGTGCNDEAGALARALERFRLAALATNREARLDSMTLAEAGDRMRDASNEITRIAATAAGRALETSMDGGQATQGRAQVVQGVLQLAQQAVVIRDATNAASTALACMAQGEARIGWPQPPEPARALEAMTAG